MSYGARAINRLPIKKRWNAASESIVAAANRQIQRSANARLNRMRGPMPYNRNIMYRSPRSPQLQEVKAFDVVITGIANTPLFAAVVPAEPGIAFTGITEVNNLIQGATVANRIGNKIMMKSVDLKLGFHALAAFTGVLRIMLVYDRQPNGAFATLTDMLLSQPLGAAQAFSGINIANKSRFQMIRDQYLPIDPGAGMAHVVHWYCKGRWETEYGASAGNIGDLRTGAMLVVAYIAITSGVGSVVLNNGQCRIRYFD